MASETVILQKNRKPTSKLPDSSPMVSGERSTTFELSFMPINAVLPSYLIQVLIHLPARTIRMSSISALAAVFCNYCGLACLSLPVIPKGGASVAC